MRFEGKVSAWNDARGFGFITPRQGGQDVFVHITSFPAGDRPRLGLPVSFELAPGPQGKKRACQVTPLVARTPMAAAGQAGGRPPRGALAGTVPARWGLASACALPLFGGLALGVAWRWGLPWFWWAWYLGAAVLSFAVYGWDKSAALQGARRVPERILHLLALAGGWPGALLAQQWLRHKSSKADFRAVFWATVVANVAGFTALATPWGRALLAGLALPLQRS